MLKATITKYRVFGRIMGDSIIETNREKLNTYSESETDIGGDTDKYTQAEKKRKFIERVSLKVVNRNREQENKFKRSRGASFEVLVITNIN